MKLPQRDPKPHRRLPLPAAWRRAAGLALALATGLTPRPACAVTTLTVELSTSLGPATHAASGSLYGVTETLPADVNALVAPLHPHMFTNPAANVQQPRGDAIVVAGRLAPTGATVTIRLADWFPSWPYAFTNVNDWFDKLAQTVSRKQAATKDNFYGYEIWNEPDGTWKNSLSFNDFWQQSYAKLRALDPTAKIIGPSYSYYNATTLNSFLSFAKANSCLPDIVSWHELSGGNLTANLQGYRMLEQQLGIGPLPISINEYSGKDDLSVEGQPGASAPLIAKFERFRVDSACISYWDVAHAGRLGSLLATDTAPNGGWWFYKWYGDMSGNMVSTTPPTPSSPSALDGFANLDATTGFASVALGGTNDGSVNVVVKGFTAAPFFGTSVHAVVEKTPFANRSTAVMATTTLSTADYTISGDAITVPITGTNGTDGYRVYLTPVGGFSGSGGAGGGAGAAAGGANAGRGGSGAGARGGAGGRPNGGAGGVVPSMGGAGAANVAGAPSSVGTGGYGGASSAAAGTGGAIAAAGGSTSGGTSRTGGHGAVPSGGGAAGDQRPSPEPRSDSGCACRTPRGRRAPSPAPQATALLGLAAWLYRKRRRRDRYSRAHAGD